MNTAFDILTMAIFAGLIVLFLQRSVGEPPEGDAMWQYLVAAVGCAASNYVGNQGYTVIAVFMITATLIFILRVLRPFERPSQP
jgi:hypothetical protein